LGVCLLACVVCAAQDVVAALRHGAHLERCVAERRLPADVAALAARLADDVAGNQAFAR
jgi:hypothetical protein